MVLETASSSKAGTIRSLLIRAWRERWSDLQWGINIKTVLPRCVSGDVHHLADYILQQALMGPLPNNLILSYLKHSLCSQVVSYAGVIESISKYDGLHKPHCVHALLQMLQSIMQNVWCRGKPEDCLQLATSLVGGVKWIVQVMASATKQLLELQTAPEHSANLNLAGSVLLDIKNSEFLMCMLEIGRNEEPDQWMENSKKFTELETLLAGAGAVEENKELLIETICCVRDSAPLNNMNGSGVVYDSSSVPMCYIVHSLVMLEVNLFTTRDSQAFAKHLLILKKLKGLTLEQLYYELLRASFFGLSCNDHNQHQELKWVGFTFIKVPTILQIIHTALKGDLSSTGPSEELLCAVRRLATQTQLLDHADLRINCYCLEYLLKELCNGLITEREAQAIISQRTRESNTLAGILQNDSQNAHPGTPNLILRAQPTVNKILRTLSNRNQESVLPMMHLLISGKSRDLLLAAAAASGQLHIFAQKFVKFNELSMVPQSGENPKMAVNRALMFDISFLLLCHIAQIYGIDVVVSETCDTFVECWMKENMPEAGRVKAPLSKITTDHKAVEDFLRQIEIQESEMKYSMVCWSDVCCVSGVTLREVVSAAQQRAVHMQFVKGLLDRMRHHLCCLPLCVATWLCHHVQVVEGEEASQPMQILQYLQTSSNEHDPQVPILDNFKDRSTLMSQIIENMITTMKGGLQSNGNNNNNTEATDSPRDELEFTKMDLLHQPLAKLLEDAWKQIFPIGSIQHGSLATFRDLLRLGGTRWFVEDIVKHGLQSVFQSDLNKAVDLIYGLLHLDIVGCTLSLLVHTMPLYISGPCTSELLCEPRIRALAQLTVMMISAAWGALQIQNLLQQQQQKQQQQQQSNGDSEAAFLSFVPVKLSVKRSYQDRDLEELEANLRLHSGELAVIRATPGLATNAQALLTATNHLLKLCAQVSRAGVVSPVQQLITHILMELVSAPNTVPLLALLPPTLLPNLLPLLSPPQTFSYSQLLLCTMPPRDNSLESGTDNMSDFLSGPTPGQAAGLRRTAAKLICLQRSISEDIKDL
ncbi:unnamed protein product, partial [Meganyctiphanes norvegica]